MSDFVDLRNQIFLRLAGAILFAFGALAGTSAAFAQSASAESDAVVVSPLSLVPVEDLNFGNLIPGTLGGTAVVSPTGTRTVTGSVTAAGGTVSNAEFQGFGTRNRFVFISTASSTYTLTRQGGGGTMVMRALTLQADNLTPRFFPGLFRISSTDVITLRIGATLDVGANQREGVYTGTFPVTMNYF